MGRALDDDQVVQYVIPANTWQAGELIEGGSYALFGCTMSPGFTNDCFEGGDSRELMVKYHNQKKLILRLSPSQSVLKLPKAFNQ